MFGPHWEDNSLGYQNTFGGPNGSYINASMNQQFLGDEEKFGLIPRSIE